MTDVLPLCAQCSHWYFTELTFHPTTVGYFVDICSRGKKLLHQKIVNEWMNENLYTAQNFVRSQCQIHTAHTCELLQAKNYQRTLILKITNSPYAPTDADKCFIFTCGWRFQHFWGTWTGQAGQVWGLQPLVNLHSQSALFWKTNMFFQIRNTSTKKSLSCSHRKSPRCTPPPPPTPQKKKRKKKEKKKERRKKVTVRNIQKSGPRTNIYSWTLTMRTHSDIKDWSYASIWIKRGC